VTTSEEARDRGVHDAFVADDAAADFARDGDEAVAEQIDLLADGRSRHKSPVTVRHV